MPTKYDYAYMIGPIAAILGDLTEIGSHKTYRFENKGLTVVREDFDVDKGYYEHSVLQNGELVYFAACHAQVRPNVRKYVPGPWEKALEEINQKLVEIYQIDVSKPQLVVS